MSDNKTVYPSGLEAILKKLGLTSQTPEKIIPLIKQFIELKKEFLGLEDFCEKCTDAKKYHNLCEIDKCKDFPKIKGPKIKKQMNLVRNAMGAADNADISELIKWYTQNYKTK